MSATSESNTAPNTTPDKRLFTPGPLLTSYTTKAAMLHDLGSRDIAFINVVKEIRRLTVELAGVSTADWTMIPMQGSGTFGVEATITSVVPANKKLLVVANGAYGLRMQKMAAAHGMGHELLSYPDDTAPSLDDIRSKLQDPDVTHVAMVHSETTSGIINDIHSAGQVVKECGRTFIVDAMSSFGAMPIDVTASHISYLVTSANKCIQGVPGFAIVLANKAQLEADKGNARTLSMDIHDQVTALDRDGQFRFTPPTHAILAFRQALDELLEEGGVEGRNQRYQENRRVMAEGMGRLGFKQYLAPHLQGPIITTYRYPNDPKFDFSEFYDRLNQRDMVIYPGKITNADCFRIGHIGHLFPSHTRQLVAAIEEVAQEMGFDSSA